MISLCFGIFFSGAKMPKHQIFFAQEHKNEGGGHIALPSAEHWKIYFRGFLLHPAKEGGWDPDTPHHLDPKGRFGLPPPSFKQ